MNSRLVALIWLAFALSVVASRERLSLSPKTWFSRDLRRLEALQSAPPRPKPLAFSNGKGLVAGTSSALAVHAGTEALSKGGNAMDGCLTTALTEIVLSAGSRVSYAGAANILYYDSISGDTYNLDAGWNKPYYVDSAQIPDDPSQGTNGASVLVPGFIAGVSTAAEKFSLFPLSKLLEPAQYFAQKGFKVSEDLAEAIKKHYNSKTLLRTREGKNIFTNPITKKPYQAGEKLKQPKLAKFIKRLAKHGKDYFYRGHWAEEMAEMAQNHEGYVTMEDMNEYEVRTLQPASTQYQHYEVLTTGTDWGGAELIEMLNLMELAGIGNSTDSYLTNATKLFWLASITRLSSFISFFTHAVPTGRQILKDNFDLDITASDRTEKGFAEELWDRIASPSRMRELNDLMQEMLTTNIGGLDMQKHRHGSSGVVAVDSEGNVCSLVHGADSELWGTGLFVEGVSLPSAGISFKPFMKQTGAGGRLPSGHQPVIVFKKDYVDFNTGGRHKRDIPVHMKDRRLLMKKKINTEISEQKSTPRGQSRLNDSFISHSVSNKSQQPAAPKKDHGMDNLKGHKNVPLAARNTPVQNTKGKEARNRGKPSSFDDKIPRFGKRSSEPSTSGSHVSLPLIILRGSPPKKQEGESSQPSNTDFKGEEMVESTDKGEFTADHQDELEWDLEDMEAIDLEDIREVPHLGISESWSHGDDNDEPKDEIFPVGLIPVLSLACIGPSHPFIVPQYLTNILDSGMNPKAALESPTFLTSSRHSYQQDIQVEKYAIDENILLDVDELGQLLTEVDFKKAEYFAGTGVAVTFDNRGKMLGCAYPYKEGFAEGVSALQIYK